MPGAFHFSKTLKGRVMRKLLQRLRRNNKGSTAIEYGLVIALIALGAMLSFQAVGVSFNSILEIISDSMDKPTGAVNN